MGRLLRQIGIASLMTAVVIVPLVVFSPQTVRPEPEYFAPYNLPALIAPVAVPPTFTIAPAPSEVVPTGALGQQG